MPLVYPTQTQAFDYVTLSSILWPPYMLFLLQRTPLFPVPIQPGSIAFRKTQHEPGAAPFFLWMLQVSASLLPEGAFLGLPIAPSIHHTTALKISAYYVFHLALITLRAGILSYFSCNPQNLARCRLSAINKYIIK